MVKLGLDMSGFSYWFTANAALNIWPASGAPFHRQVGPRRTLRIGLLVLLLSAIALTPPCTSSIRWP